MRSACWIAAAILSGCGGHAAQTPSATVGVATTSGGATSVGTTAPAVSSDFQVSEFSINKSADKLMTVAAGSELVFDGTVAASTKETKNTAGVVVNLVDLASAKREIANSGFAKFGEPKADQPTFELKINAPRKPGRYAVRIGASEPRDTDRVVVVK